MGPRRAQLLPGGDNSLRQANQDVSKAKTSSEEAQRRCERRQKRGKQAGMRARLRATSHKPAVPSVFLANSHSLVNKINEIKLRTTKTPHGQLCYGDN